MVQTRDNGYQPISWIGQCTVAAVGKNAPIHFATGVLGNTQGLLVPPNHRMLIVVASADLYFGDNEVLVPAKHLIGRKGVERCTGGKVTYFHILFDQHQIVIANAAPSESFFPGEEGMESLSSGSRDEVLSLFPELRTAANPGFQDTARICLNRYETSVLRQVLGPLH